MNQSPPTHPNNGIPPRFRAKAFRRYEPYINEVVKRFPKRVLFPPESFPVGVNSCVTFACRLRDAIKSLRDYQWPTKIPMALFMQRCDEIVVSEQVNFVACGDEDCVRGTSLITNKPLENLSHVALSPHAPAIEGRNSSLPDFIDLTVFAGTQAIDTLRAVAMLSHSRALLVPITLKGDLSILKPLATQLEGVYDIGIETDEQAGTITVY